MPDAEVDQSIHIEHTRGDTILALSDNLRYAIRIPVSVKRAATHFLHSKRKHPTSKKRIALQMYAAALYLLLKEYITRLNYVVIDIEYWGYDSEVRGMILAYFQRDGIRVPSNRIAFRQIGKTSHAHELAIRTYRGELVEDKRITETEFLTVLK
ncbi:MAG: hypothetical protein A2Z03_11205 [Chloroflexi bacterium RBG_16_56_8]|nr:MAG: hypothetical protein A2Z03_11205 [Chloroflexi bacterium RBG_16_56_8]